MYVLGSRSYENSVYVKMQQRVMIGFRTRRF